MSTLWLCHKKLHLTQLGVQLLGDSPKRHNLRGSMSANGCCYDNACAESFFHSLKVECIHGERFISREIMRTTVFNYIECDYNRWRRDSACGGISPEQFENQTLA